MKFISFNIKDSNTDEIKFQVDEFEVLTEPFTGNARHKAYGIAMSLIQIGIIKDKFIAKFESSKKLIFEAEINPTQKQLKLINSFIKLREKINSPYLTTLETLSFAVDETDRTMIDCLNTIIVRSRKGTLNITKDQLSISIPLIEKHTTPSKG